MALLAEDAKCRTLERACAARKIAVGSADLANKVEGAIEPLLAESNCSPS